MSAVDVLAVAAHPDDAEVGCGGTIALCVQAGARVAIVDLTSGELSTAGTPELRQSEAAAAAEALGVQTRISIGLPDGSLGTSPSHRDELVGVFRTLRPRIVLAPYHLGDRHPDHAAAGKLARDASFFGGVRRVAVGEPHRPERIYHYMLHHVFMPVFVVDVSRFWSQREEAVAAYRSQLGHARGEELTAIGGQAFLRWLSARAQTFGAMIGAEYGEAYTCEGPLGFGQLPGLERPVATPIDYRAFL
jgi:N-acetylglucosamine malate deacetylase 1